MAIYSYKNLIVWQKSFQLVILIYQVTKNFPKDELYGIVSQMRRCVVSVPSNIAEGYGRRRKLGYLQFLHIAYGSACELETQLLLSKELGYLSEESFNKASSLLTEVLKMLNSMITKVKENRLS